MADKDIKIYRPSQAAPADINALRQYITRELQQIGVAFATMADEWMHFIPGGYTPKLYVPNDVILDRAFLLLHWCRQGLAQRRR